MKTKSLVHLSALIDTRLHQFEEIPLKNEGLADCCYPSSGPTLYISGRKDSKVFDLPKEGTAKIAYRVRSKTVNYREGGDESYSSDIEVQSIEPTGLEAIVERYQHFSDRARDTGGRYSPGVAVSADDMADAYVKPKDTKKKALLAGAAAAGIGAVIAGRKAGPSISRGVGRLVRSAIT